MTEAFDNDGARRGSGGEGGVVRVRGVGDEVGGSRGEEYRKMKSEVS